MDAMNDDPFAHSYELRNHHLGPEIWQVKSNWYTAAVRFHIVLKKYMLCAVGMIDGELHHAVQVFDDCPEYDAITQLYLDQAFKRAGVRSRKIMAPAITIPKGLLN